MNNLPPEVGLMTPILALGTLAVWFVLEMFYIWNGMPSISTQISTLYHQWPTFGMLFALVVGLLLGHWFWTK